MIDPASLLIERFGSAVRSAEPLWRHASYRIGGPADFFLNARSTDEIKGAVSAAAQGTISWRLIGSASNLLVADEGVEGLVIKASSRGLRFDEGTGPDDEVLVRADAGCMLATVAKKATMAGLTGLEWAASVPGTVGAAVVNNSGAFGSSIAECLEQATIFAPDISEEQPVSAADLGYAYRTSRLKRHEWSAAVLHATFRTHRGDSAALRARLGEVEEARRVTQPFGPSVGSVFRNPPGNFAGALIEQAGLKGTRVGDVEISPLHANFMLNVGHARARDVLSLIQHVQQTVWERFQVWLIPEMELVGRWHPEDFDRISGPSEAVTP